MSKNEYAKQCNSCCPGSARIKLLSDLRCLLLCNVQKKTNAEASGLRGTRQRGADIIPGGIVVSVNNKAVSSYDDMRNKYWEDRTHYRDPSSQLADVPKRDGIHSDHQRVLQAA
jgi:hypothetical protein